MSAEADALVRTLGLVAHPEGGHYRETYRHHAADGGRGAVTAIYYLLKAGERSAWHRVKDAVEIWHYYGGSPLALRVAAEGGDTVEHRLGLDIAGGARPQAVVPAGAWQNAESLGAWTLVGCTVAPAFVFATFELAPDGWRPG